VRGLKKPGKYYDGGGLMLQATPTKTKGVVTKAWLYRFQIDHRERFMGLGSARVVSLAEARAQANAARQQLAAGVDPLAARNSARMAARAAELHTATFRHLLDQLLDSHGDKWRAKHATQYRNSTAGLWGSGVTEETMEGKANNRNDNRGSRAVAERMTD
jgi:hypothetical protein